MALTGKKQKVDEAAYKSAHELNVLSNEMQRAMELANPAHIATGRITIHMETVLALFTEWAIREVKRNG
jgi:hypothetical protein